MARMTAAGATGSDRRGPGLTLDQSARRLGALVAAKQLEFERLGSWARSVTDANVKIALARISAHQGWAAEQLEFLLPSTRDHNPAAVVAEERSRLSSEPSGQLGPDGELNPEELVQRARFTLLSLIQAAADLGDELSPVSDAASRRVLALVAQSDRQDVDSLTDLGISGEEAQVSR